VTDDEYLLWEFRNWSPNDPSANVPEEFRYMPPGCAWDSTEDHPPFEVRPCPKCDAPSQPRCRFEFKREDDPVLGWATGIAFFAWRCPEHDLFIGDVIERQARPPRNGRVGVL
jgi:hypothetical protein